MQDVVDYSARADDDLFFLFDPFPNDVLKSVVDNPVQGARAQHRPIKIIYTERLLAETRRFDIIEQEDLFSRDFEKSSWGNFSMSTDWLSINQTVRKPQQRYRMSPVIPSNKSCFQSATSGKISGCSDSCF